MVILGLQQREEWRPHMLVDHIAVLELIKLTHNCYLQVESFSLDQDDLEEDTFLLSNEALTGADVRTVDPDTQARLEALLDAAGKEHQNSKYDPLPHKCSSVQQA